MFEIKFAEPSTMDAPPMEQRRKRTLPEQVHERHEWEALMPRVKKLYDGHKITEVIDKLGEEGFIASERQLRSRLGATENYKNLRLTDSQWRFIGKSTVTRNLQNNGRKTAFRYKNSKERIPSMKIKRNLERRLEQKEFFDVASVCGTISSHGISVYTSRTHGFRLKRSFLRFSKTRPTNSKDMSAPAKEVSLGPENQFGDLAGALLVHSMNILLRKYPDDTFKLGLVDDSNIAITCADCPGYSFLIGLSFRPRLGMGVELAVRNGSYVAAVTMPQQTHGSSPISAFMDLTQLREFFPVALRRFENEHLLNNFHRKRVRLRLLGNPGQWVGRTTFVDRTGTTCGHIVPPKTVHPEDETCWRLGGCRWSQFKAVEVGQAKEPLKKKERYPIIAIHATEERDIEHLAGENKSTELVPPKDGCQSSNQRANIPDEDHPRLHLPKDNGIDIQRRLREWFVGMEKQAVDDMGPVEANPAEHFGASDSLEYIDLEKVDFETAWNLDFEGFQDDCLKEYSGGQFDGIPGDSASWLEGFLDDSGSDIDGTLDDSGSHFDGISIIDDTPSQHDALLDELSPNAGAANQLSGRDLEELDENSGSPRKPAASADMEPKVADEEYSHVTEEGFAEYPQEDEPSYEHHRPFWGFSSEEEACGNLGLSSDEYAFANLAVALAASCPKWPTAGQCYETAVSSADSGMAEPPLIDDSNFPDVFPDLLTGPETPEP